MNDLRDILKRNPIGVCPVDDSPEALEALNNVKGQLRPLVTLITPDGHALSSTYDGTQPALVLYDTPQTGAGEDALGVRWLFTSIDSKQEA